MVKHTLDSIGEALSDFIAEAMNELTSIKTDVGNISNRLDDIDQRFAAHQSIQDVDMRQLRERLDAIEKKVNI